MGTFAAGQRVETLVRGSCFEGGVERYVGTIVTGAERQQREDGVGDLEPHVRVLYDGYDSPVWEPVRKLKATR